MIAMKPMRERRRYLVATDCAARRLSLWISVWLIALVALGNPFACLFHCWYHTHDPVATAAMTVQPAVAQAHHGAAHHNNPGQTAITDQPPTPNNSSSTFSCSLTHEILSALTIAVLGSLLRLVIPFNPGIPLSLPRLSLRLVIFPPPHRPPRFAPFCLHHDW